jgi:hypothetical protein
VSTASLPRRGRLAAVVCWNMLRIHAWCLFSPHHSDTGTYDWYPTITSWTGLYGWSNWFSCCSTYATIHPIVNAVRYVRQLRTFWGNLLPPYSTLNMTSAGPPKCWLCTRLHGIISQKIVFFITSAGRTAVSPLPFTHHHSSTNYHPGSFTQLKLLTSLLYYLMCYLTE